MISTRRDLLKKAGEILKQKGFTDDEIHEEFGFKNYRVDAVGWSPNRRVAIQCGYCPPEEQRDLERFFDEVICLASRPEAKAASAKRSPLAKTTLMLVKGGDVVFEVPLSREERPRRLFEDEMRFIEEDMQQFSRLFDALSHRNRLRMMKLLVEEKDLTMGFSEFIRNLDLNPKLVWESTRKLGECGLVEKGANGRYRCSEFGEASFIMVSFVFKHLREMFEST